MLKKIFYLILILKLTQARYGVVPKFFGQDSAIIVDTGKSLTDNKNGVSTFTNKIRIPPPFPLWRHYPRYRIIPPPPPGQILAINTWAKTAQTKPITVPSSSTTTTSTTTTTTTTTTPKPTTTTASSLLIAEDEFPPELLDIAQNKLGLKSLDEIPSISELGQLLGTNSSKETLNYIKQLTLNEQGVALIKAYIESTDYTDNSDFLQNQNDFKDEEEKEDEKIGDIGETVKVNDEGLIVITDDDLNDDYYASNNEEEKPEDISEKPSQKSRSKTPKIIQKLKESPQTHPSFMERVVNYMHLNNLFHKNEKVLNSKETKLTTDKEYHEINRVSENGQNTSIKQKTQTKDPQENQTESETLPDQETQDSKNLKTPNLIRESIPYNYPVPIRFTSSSTTTTTTSTTPAPLSTFSVSYNTPGVHLNTPKMLIPHVQQLSRVTKIPTQKIEDFLASKPKLLELATKVSRFPIGYDRNSPIEAQVMAAVQKAIEQDEDLQKLLSSTATLK